MFIYKVDNNVILSTIKPRNCEFLEVENLPDGNGKLCTDLKTIWWESWPEKEPMVIKIDPKIQALADRQAFLEDCIAEMAQIIYS